MVNREGDTEEETLAKLRPFLKIRHAPVIGAPAKLPGTLCKKKKAMHDREYFQNIMAITSLDDRHEALDDRYDQLEVHYKELSRKEIEERARHNIEVMESLLAFEQVHNPPQQRRLHKVEKLGDEAAGAVGRAFGVEADAVNAARRMGALLPPFNPVVADLVGEEVADWSRF